MLRCDINYLFMTIFKALNPDLYNIVGQNLFITNSKLNLLIKENAEDEEDVQTIKQVAVSKYGYY